MDQEEKRNKQIKLVLDSENKVEEYANFAVVTHSPAEFVIDFFRILPGISEAKVKSRIIMSPVHLKTLVRALQDNINKYEDKFGEIIIKSDGKSPKFNLPDDVTQNSIKASMKDGVLALEIPRMEKIGPEIKKISIK